MTTGPFYLKWSSNEPWDGCQREVWRGRAIIFFHTAEDSRTIELLTVPAFLWIHCTIFYCELYAARMPYTLVIARADNIVIDVFTLPSMIWWGTRVFERMIELHIGGGVIFCVHFVLLIVIIQYNSLFSLFCKI